MNNSDLNDEMRDEYDLKNLVVRKVGEGRKNIKSNVIQLDSDVAEVFPNSASVNEALRFLVRIARENQLPIELRK